MVQNARASTIVLLVLLLLFLFLAGGTFYLFQKEHAKNIDLQAQLEDVTNKQRIAETRLADSERKADKLESDLTINVKKLNELKTDLENEKKLKAEALSQVDQLTTELKKQETAKSDLESRLNQSKAELDKIASELKALDSKKADLEKKVKDMEAQMQQSDTEGVELGTIVVGPESLAASSSLPESSPSMSAGVPAAPASGALEGKVLVINKDYNFVVINMGANESVELGSIFSVYHNNSYIGDVKVEKVHETMSAAGFTAADMKNKVNEGDKVVQKSK